MDLTDALSIKRNGCRGRRLAHILLGPSIGLLMSGAAAGADTAHATSSETIEETTCRIVESAAHSDHLPVSLLTRLVWIESRFQAGVVSSAGAQGVAQFMPQTAAERGLADPFDPEQAIPMAAKLLVDLDQQFGNIGLAAAAYNAGPNRVAGWLGGSGDLPRQTRVYVFLLTARTAEDWAAQGRDATPTDETVDRRSCMDVRPLPFGWKRALNKLQWPRGASSSPEIFRRQRRWRRSSALDSAIPVSSAICSQ
jgi:hypothetical protein